jgi:hypothetical protein
VEDVGRGDFEVAG